MAVAILAQKTENLNFNFAGTMRNCVVHVPSGISKPAVVFFVPGYGGSGASFESDTKADIVADREKFIAVYPTALGQPPSWDMQTTNDFPFLLALIDTVDNRYHIDRNRIYCAGFSQGGFISFGIGCKYPDIFAAVAPVSGHIPSFAATQTTLKRPISMFLTFGTQDYGIVNGDVSSFMTDIKTWLKFDSNTTAPTRIRPYPTTNTKSVITRVTYKCAQGTQVMYDSIVGGQHEWGMDTVTKVNTSEEVWAFFKQFSLPGSTSILQHSVTATHDCISATYSAGIVHLQGAGDKCRVQVVDTKGRVVAVATAVQGQFAFKDKPSGVYMVVLNGKNAHIPLRIMIP